MLLLSWQHGWLTQICRDTSREQHYSNMWVFKIPRLSNILRIITYFLFHESALTIMLPAWSIYFNLSKFLRKELISSEYRSNMWISKLPRLSSILRIIINLHFSLCCRLLCINCISWEWLFSIAVHGLRLRELSGSILLLESQA